MEQDIALEKVFYSMSGFDAMDQNSVFKKEYYFMSGFDAKHIFLRRMVKI